jgi:hypothetical protein
MFDYMLAIGIIAASSVILGSTCLVLLILAARDTRE